jgi:hypothetical protein
MNGELAPAVSLVSYGDAWLRRLFDLDSVDWTTHSTLRHVAGAEFRLRRRYLHPRR